MMALCSLPGWGAPARAEDAREWDLSGEGSVSLDTRALDVDVVGWDQPRVRLSGGAGAGDEIRIRTASPTRLVLAIQSNRNHRRGAGMDSYAAARLPGATRIRLQVPFSVTLTVTTVGGDVSVHDLRDAPNVALESVGGDVRVDANARAMKLRSVGGDIDVAGRMHELDIGSVSGDLRLAGVRSDRVSASLVSGDFTAKRLDATRLEVESVSGSVSIDGTPAGNADWRLSSVAGDLDLRLGGGLDTLAIEAETRQGNISADGIGFVEANASDSRPQRLHSLPPKATGRLHIESFSGDIRIHGS